MTADDYLRSVLAKYASNSAAAVSAAQSIYPLLQQWGSGYLLNAEWSGSIAKGTAVSLGTDADVFLSVSPTTPGTLAQMYGSLWAAVSKAGIATRQQNVSVQVKVNGYAIDLVPGRRQSNQGSDHSLYRSKQNSWTQTNVSTHITHVTGSGRADEIKVLKIWRHLHSLEFPSFYLELAVIDALLYARRGNLASNVWTALTHLRDKFPSARYVDPANTNNIVSDDCTATEKNAIANRAAHSLLQKSWGSIVW